MRFRRLFTVSLLVACVLFGAGCTPGSSETSSALNTTRPRAGETTGKEDSTQARAQGPSASDNSRTLAQRLHDASVKARVKKALVERRELRPYDFFVEVVRGSVTLRGDVDTRTQYRLVEKTARRVDGVRTLTSRVTVQGRTVEEEEAGSSNGTDSGDRAYYTVQQGDSLWEIAQEHGVSVERLKALNSGSLTSIQPGQRLRIR